MTKHHYPPRLRSKADRARFDRVVSDLRRHDLDPDSRAELIADFVELDRQIANLRKDAKGGSIATRMAATRALNVSSAERRRLHQRLFAGGRRPEEKLPPVAAVAAERMSEADEAWRRHIHGHRLGLRAPLRSHVSLEEDRRIAEWEREREQLEARFGKPSWNALLYETMEEQIKGERAIAKFHKRDRPRLPIEVGTDGR